jgi:O-antigen/teichoic acid export membrane protein
MAQLDEVLRVVGLMVILVTSRTVPESLLRKQLLFDKLSQTEIVAGLVSIAAMFSLAWAGAGIWALVAGALVDPLVKCAMGFWLSGWWPGLQFHAGRLKAFLRFSFSKLGSNICWSIQSQSDLFLLAKVAGDTVLGQYSMGKIMAFAAAGKISMMILQLGQPLLAELQNDQKAIQQSLRRGVRLLAVIIIPICLGLAVVADDLIQVVLLDKWLPMVPFFQVMSLAAMIAPLDVLFTPVLLARYRASFIFRYNLVLLIAMPLAFGIGALWEGAFGMSLVWVTVYPCILGWMVREALHEIGLSFRWLYEEVQSPILASLVMVVLAVSARWAYTEAFSEAPVQRLAVVTLVGMAAYATVLWTIGRSLCAELIEVARWVIRPGPKVELVK